MIDRLETNVRHWARRLAFIGVIGLLGMSIAILIDALARWLFKTPVHGLEDVNGLLISVIVASFLPSVLIDRRNIAIEFVGKVLGNRVDSWLTVFGNAIVLLFFLIVARYFIAHAGTLSDQTTLILKLPTAPAMWLTAAMLALCVPVQILVVAGDFVRAVRGEQPGDQEGHL